MGEWMSGSQSTSEQNKMTWTHQVGAVLEDDAGQPLLLCR